MALFWVTACDIVAILSDFVSDFVNYGLGLGQTTAAAVRRCLYVFHCVVSRIT